MTPSYNATSQRELRNILYQLLGNELSNFNLNKMIIKNADVKTILEVFNDGYMQLTNLLTSGLTSNLK